MNWAWVVRVLGSLAGIAVSTLVWAQAGAAPPPGQAASSPQQMTTTIVIGAAVLSVFAIILALVTRPQPSAPE